MQENRKKTKILREGCKGPEGDPATLQAPWCRQGEEAAGGAGARSKPDAIHGWAANGVTP